MECVFCGSKPCICMDMEFYNELKGSSKLVKIIDCKCGEKEVILEQINNETHHSHGYFVISLIGKYTVANIHRDVISAKESFVSEVKGLLYTALPTGLSDILTNSRKY